MTAREIDAPDLLPEGQALPPLSEADIAALLTTVRELGKGLRSTSSSNISSRRSSSRRPRVAAVASRSGISLRRPRSRASSRSRNTRAGGPPAGLDQFVQKLAGSHMDDMIELAALDRASAEAFIRDAQTYETSEVRLRHELGRDPTAIELAAQLGWPRRARGDRRRDAQRSAFALRQRDRRIPRRCRRGRVAASAGGRRHASRDRAAPPRCRAGSRSVRSARAACRASGRCGR